MFALHKALVHYGTSSYPLNGLPSKYDRISGLEDLDVEVLAQDVGHLTQYPREFTARHILPQTLEFGGQKLEIEERIYASANGYSITWVREVA
jgi:hypothetical protein